MVNDIISQISLAIANEFGDDYEIYTELSTQDLRPPCFAIKCIQAEDKHYINNRYQKEYQFIIRYFPNSDEINKECNEVAEGLFACLELIGGNKYRSSDMSSKLIDEVLQFEVNYDFFALKSVQQEDSMDSYKIKTKKG